MAMTKQEKLDKKAEALYEKKHKKRYRNIGSMRQARAHQNGTSASRTISSVSDGMIWKIWSNTTLLIVSESI